MMRFGVTSTERAVNPDRQRVTGANGVPYP